MLSVHLPARCRRRWWRNSGAATRSSATRSDGPCLARPVQAQDVHRLLRTRLSAADKGAADVLLLYGGSVKAANAKSLFGCPDIDGGLIGGASLKADEFLAIAGA